MHLNLTSTDSRHLITVSYNLKVYTVVAVVNSRTHKWMVYDPPSHQICMLSISSLFLPRCNVANASIDKVMFKKPEF
jgi:hypothetical protein